MRNPNSLNVANCSNPSERRDTMLIKGFRLFLIYFLKAVVLPVPVSLLITLNLWSPNSAMKSTCCPPSLMPNFVRVIVRVGSSQSIRIGLYLM